MPTANQRPPLKEKPNVERLRHAIDTGKTRDKARIPDPAAAPLGTDEEAGGTPPTPEQVAAAAQLEMAQRVLRGDDRTSDAVILIAVLLTVVVTVVAILWTRY
jgi:hypothetical protein